jgi:hypothetical protein
VAVLAVVLPIAIPYVVWAQSDAPCAKYAAGAVRSAEYIRLPRTPVSVDVFECALPPAGPAFRAKVTVHGPYGIPLESYSVTGGNIQQNGSENTVFAALALLGGVAFVSLPFGIALANSWLRTRQAMPA